VQGRKACDEGPGQHKKNQQRSLRENRDACNFPEPALKDADIYVTARRPVIHNDNFLGAVPVHTDAKTAGENQRMIIDAEKFSTWPTKQTGRGGMEKV